MLLLFINHYPVQLHTLDDTYIDYLSLEMQYSKSFFSVIVNSMIGIQFSTILTQFVPLIFSHP